MWLLKGLGKESETGKLGILPPAAQLGQRGSSLIKTRPRSKSFFNLPIFLIFILLLLLATLGFRIVYTGELFLAATVDTSKRKEAATAQIIESAQETIERLWTGINQQLLAKYLSLPFLWMYPNPECNPCMYWQLDNLACPSIRVFSYLLFTTWPYALPSGERCREVLDRVKGEQYKP